MARWLMILLLAAGLTAGYAAETEPADGEADAVTEEAFDLDDFDGEEEEEAAEEEAPVHPHAKMYGGAKPPGLAVKAAVDFTLEYLHADKKELTFGTNHQYLVLNIQPKPMYRLWFELTEAVFWEFHMMFGPGHKLKLGKIAIPFGPVFLHQILGGVVEKPTAGGGHVTLMVPEVWAEYGLCYERKLVDGAAYTLEGKVWMSNGLAGEVKAADRTVDFTGATRSRDNNLDKAIGIRMDNTFRGRYGLNFSAYTCKWADDKLTADGALDENFWEGDRLFLVNGELELGYGSLPWPVAKDFSILFEQAFIRTRSTQRTATVDNTVPWHTKSANIVQVRYKGLGNWCEPQFRYGIYDDNHDVTNARDLINYNFALRFRMMPGVSVIPMYMINREMVNEKNDDFFFLKFFIEI